MFVWPCHNWRTPCWPILMFALRSAALKQLGIFLSRGSKALAPLPKGQFHEPRPLTPPSVRPGAPRVGSPGPGEAETPGFIPFKNVL